MIRSVLLVLVLGCGDDAATDASVDASPDASVDASADASVDANADASVDARDTDVPGDAGADAFDVCEGACTETSVRAVFGAAEETFNLAYFGRNLDGTLRVELYGGADEGCPTMDSPTPDRTVVIPSLVMPMDGTAQDIQASLLDFAGTLTTEPILRASSASATPVAAGGAFVRFDLSATFDGGDISGAVYATECASLAE